MKTPPEKLHSDDPDIKKLAGSRIQVLGIGELPLPAADAQFSMQLSVEPKQPPDADPSAPDE